MARQPKIGQRLAAARLRRGESQVAVARDAGIAPSYLSRIETGKVQPTFRTLARVAKAIGMHFEELAEFESERHQHGVKCPITKRGFCLLDLIRADSERAREQHEGFYTARQIKLLRRFARWLEAVPPDRQYAMEVLMGDLMGARGLELDDDGDENILPS